jgi:hypothetical protein
MNQETAMARPTKPARRKAAGAKPARHLQPAAARQREHANGRTANTLRLPAEVWKRLRIAAVINDTSQAEIVIEALNEWFRKRPLPGGL